MYKYGMRLRGFGCGSQPNGFVKWEDCDKNITGYWSYVWYDFKLDNNDLFTYSMDLLSD